MHSRRGFTLVELLAVITIIGVLASIAIPKLQATKEKAFVASMVSDLRNVMTGQEAFFTNNNDYAGGVWAAAELPGTGGAGRMTFVPSPGNVITMSRRTTTGVVGWRATIRNPAVTTTRTDVCGIYVGHTSFAPNPAVTREGVPMCY